MHRFFIEPPGRLAPGDTLALPQKLAHQARDVLKLASEERIVLLDNSGEEIVAELVRSNRAGVEVRIVERRAGRPEPAVRIILCQGLLKSARFEWILEKGTEIGVSVFAPMLCRRSTSGLEDAGPAKIERWKRIIQEAAEQSGRARVPELLAVRPLTHALNDIPGAAVALMPWEEEHEKSLRQALQAVRMNDEQKTAVLFIGPEGGLTAEEVKLAQRQGVQIVTLGKRILRAETAALVTAANVLYELDSKDTHIQLQ